jgi:hypothetical protein
MSKKSKAQREKRKNKKLKLAERATSTPSKSATSGTLADPKVRHSTLKSLVRQIPPDLKSLIVSRCGSPEEVTFLLVADPAQRVDGRVAQWPIDPEEGVAVLLAPGATEKVAITAGVIFPRNESAVEPAPRSFGQQEN